MTKHDERQGLLVTTTSFPPGIPFLPAKFDSPLAKFYSAPSNTYSFLNDGITRDSILSVLSRLKKRLTTSTSCELDVGSSSCMRLLKYATFLATTKPMGLLLLLLLHTLHNVVPAAGGKVEVKVFKYRLVAAVVSEVQIVHQYCRLLGCFVVSACRSNAGVQNIDQMLGGQK